MKLIEALKFTHLLNEQLNTLPNYTPLSSEIYEMAEEINRFIQIDQKGKYTYDKDSKGVNNGAGPKVPNDTDWPFKYYPNGSDEKLKYRICCGSYVWWILCELGYCKNGTIYGGKAKDMTYKNVQSHLRSPYSAISIGRNLDKAQKGDILVFGLNGASHTSIFHSFDGKNIYEYGMGDDVYAKGTKANPHLAKSQRLLKDIIRIIKA